MNQEKKIDILTFSLAAVAGYCDTATFVAGKQIFSAHVTGNFIVFAAQVVLGNDQDAWIKLLTFPVFIVAVMIGGWIATSVKNKYTILLIEGLLIWLAVVACLLHSLFRNNAEALTYGAVMIIVTGMGLQNAFGKLYAKETHGPTTMMTGNVTQVALDIGNRFKGPGVETLVSLKKQLKLIVGFLTGCLIGAIISKQIGLTAVVVPAITLMFCYATVRKQDNIRE